MSEEAQERYPDTSPEKLGQRMAARKKRRAKNKMRRATQNKMREAKNK